MPRPGTVQFAMSIALLAALLPMSAHAQRTPEPIESAWKSLIPTEAEGLAREAMTSAQRYEQQMREVTVARALSRNKVHSIRLRVTGVIEPTTPDRRMLIHAQYDDEGHRKTFGETATIGIWTSDYRTALELSIGDRIDLQGRVFHEVHYLDHDTGRVPSLWSEKTVNTSVAFLNCPITKWVRPMRLYMVNPVIARYESHP